MYMIIFTTHGYFASKISNIDDEFFKELKRYVKAGDPVMIVNDLSEAAIYGIEIEDIKIL